MNLLFNIFLIFMLIINVFINCSDSESIQYDTVIENSISILEITPEELDSMVCYFFHFIELYELTLDLSDLLSLEEDLIYAQYLEKLKDVVIFNTGIFRYLKKKMPKRVKSLPMTNQLLKSKFTKNTSTNKGTFSNNKREELKCILEELSNLLKKLNEYFSKIGTHFQKVRLYCLDVKTILDGLLQITINKVNLTTPKKKDNSFSKKEITKESENMANISAHQLIGCCQDGKCGSLDGKKSQDKKNKDKSKKKKEKRKNKKEDQKEEDNEKEFQGAVGGVSSDLTPESPIDSVNKVSDQEIELFLQTNPNDKNLDVSYKKDKKKTRKKIFEESNLLKQNLFRDSLDINSKIIDLLLKILSLEEILFENIAKIKSIFEMLILEKGKKYDVPTKKRLNDILINQKLQSYFTASNENSQMKINQQKYNLALKICSSSLRKEDKQNTCKSCCPHCQCRNCEATLQKENSIYCAN